MEILVHALCELQHPTQLVVVCGRSEELKGRLDALAAADRRRSHSARGGLHDGDRRVYGAADLLVGKPEGLTSSEALARGLAIAIVIVHPIPGQEERNADHLLEAGAAIQCNNLPALAWKIDRLLADPGRLAAMRANARRVARLQAARDIAATLTGGLVCPLSRVTMARERGCSDGGLQKI